MTDTDGPKFAPGDVVTISYSGYTTTCLVIKERVSPYGLDPKGWWIVEELFNSDGRSYLEEELRPRYEAAEEFMVMRGEDPAP